MYQAITTKYVGPREVRGARVLARSSSGTMVWNWDHSINYEQNHLRAAMQMAAARNWSGRWHGGGAHDGTLVWVLADRANDPRDGFTIGEQK